MQKNLVCLFLLILMCANCSSVSEEQKIQMIMSDITSLQDKQELIVKEMLTKPNIFSNENINEFPSNRLKIEPAAKEQIDLLNQTVEIENSQIIKLKEVENLKFNQNFLQYSKLNRQIFEKRLENKKLSVQKFQLVFDENVTTPELLRAGLSTIKQKQAEIDSEIKQLENQKQNIRKSAGK